MVEGKDKYKAIDDTYLLRFIATSVHNFLNKKPVKEENILPIPKVDKARVEQAEINKKDQQDRLDRAFKRFKKYSKNG